MTRLGLSNEETAALSRMADERAMLSRTRPNAFDDLRDTGRLGLGMWAEPVEINALAGRRWAVGDALRRVHAAGWQNPSGGAANPISGPLAATARARLVEIEAVVGEACWPVLVRVVIAGDSLRQCHDLLPISTRGFRRFGDDVLLDRLCIALDRIAALLVEHAA